MSHCNNSYIDIQGTNTEKSNGRFKCIFVRKNVVNLSGAYLDRFARFVLNLSQLVHSLLDLIHNNH